MDQVFHKLQHHMLEHYDSQGSSEERKHVKASYLRNFHSDKWHPSGPLLDALAGRLTRWCNDSLGE